MPDNHLFRLYREATVRVGPEGSHGSGFFVAPMLILTCWHVVEKLGEEVEVRPWQGNGLGKAIKVKVSKYYERPDDMALLEVIEPFQHPVIRLGSSYDLRDPMTAWAYSAKAVNGESATLECEGDIILEGQKYLKLKTGQIVPGMSGAPVLNEITREVCGLLRYSRDSGSDLGGLAIPISRIYTLFPEIAEAQEKVDWREWNLPGTDRTDPFQPRVLVPPRATVPSKFIGREEDVEAIRAKFTSGQRMVLISGEGGIGKTTLAAYYWEKYKAQYKTLAWLFCEGGIVSAMRKELPVPLGITDSRTSFLSENSLEDQVIKIKSRLSELPKNSLLVFDNVKKNKHLKGFLEDIGSIDCHILITSRRLKMLLDRDGEYVIRPLLKDQAIELFKRYYIEEGDSFDKDLENILELVGYNTLCIELFSKNLSEGRKWGLDLKKCLSYLKDKGIFFDENMSFEIQTQYVNNLAGNSKIRYVDQIINSLYDLAWVEREKPEMRKILIRFSLLNSNVYSVDVICQLFGGKGTLNFRKNLDILVRHGWINCDEQGYGESPVIKNLILQRFRDLCWLDGEEVVEEIINIFELEDYLYLKRFDLAVKYAEASFGFVLNLIELSKNIKIGLAIDNLWNYFVVVEDFSKAKVCANELMLLGEALASPYLKDSGNQRLADVCLRLGEVDDALNYLSESCRLREKIIVLKNYSEESMLNLAIGYSKLGDLYCDLGRFDEALIFYFRDLKLTSEVVSTGKSDSIHLRRSLIISYDKIGRVLMTIEKFQDAEGYFLKSRELSMKSLGTFPDSVPIKSSLAGSLSTLGWLSLRLEKVKDAHNFFIQAYDIYSQLSKANTGIVAFKADIADCLGNLSQSASQLGQLDQAVNFASECNQNWKKLMDTNPQSKNFKASFGISCATLSKLIQLVGKDRDKAIKLLMTGSKVFEELIEIGEQSLQNYSYRLNLGEIYANLGVHFYFMKQPSQARQYLEKARDIWKQLASQSDSPDLRKFLQKVEQDLAALDA